MYQNDWRRVSKTLSAWCDPNVIACQEKTHQIDFSSENVNFNSFSLRVLFSSFFDEERDSTRSFFTGLVASAKNSYLELLVKLHKQNFLQWGPKLSSSRSELFSNNLSGTCTSFTASSHSTHFTNACTSFLF